MNTQRKITVVLFLLGSLLPGKAQVISKEGSGEQDWERTRRILDCAPLLVERRELVEDNFNHRYVTNNPRDTEAGYFSVEPITYQEEGRRFCEALLPATGVSQTYFRGCYVTTYTLPGEGWYQIEFGSVALIFNNDIRIIQPQNSQAEIEAVHRIEIETDTALNPVDPAGPNLETSRAYTWELEVDRSGVWSGRVLPGKVVLTDTEIPAGLSSLVLERKIRGPGVVSVRESVVFRIQSLSDYKYDPIFQAACLFSLEPLSVTARLLPCEK